MPDSNATSNRAAVLKVIEDGIYDELAAYSPDRASEDDIARLAVEALEANGYRIVPAAEAAD